MKATDSTEINAQNSASTSNSATRPDFAICNGLVILPAHDDPNRLIRSYTSVAVTGGKISAIGSDAHLDALEIFDAKGLTVLPGVIDSQVHFREPGLVHKEDLETGTRGAVLGGVTTVFEMPNTKPSTTTAEAFQAKISAAKGRVWSDISFFMGATPENATELAQLELQASCCAVKIFMGSSTGTLLVADDAPLRRILASGHRRVAVHCEDEARLTERRHLVEGINNPSLHPVWRDELTALRATERLVGIAREVGRKVHVLHVTTAEEMVFLAKQKRIENQENLVTVEVTPQHLTLAAPECYERLGTLVQMNPPIRESHHREALWAAVQTGVVDVIGSDHAPHTLEEKNKPYPDSPSGMTGVQTLLPLMLDHMNQGRLSLERLVEICCRNPARLYHARNKGEIRVGNDADFTVIDIGAQRVIKNEWIASRSAWTPFDGMTVKGWPVATIVRGQVVMRDDQLIGKPIGKPILFDQV
jgi:dihydroorotase